MHGLSVGLVGVDYGLESGPSGHMSHHLLQMPSHIFHVDILLAVLADGCTQRVQILDVVQTGHFPEGRPHIPSHYLLCERHAVFRQAGQVGGVELLHQVVEVVVVGEGGFAQEGVDETDHLRDVGV